MNGYYRLVVEKLTRHGWYKKPGGKGSHEKWTDGRSTVLVPFNCKSRHTANAVLHEAGIVHKF